MQARLARVANQTEDGYRQDLEHGDERVVRHSVYAVRFVCYMHFIPIADFWPIGANHNEASFVIVGLTSITFDFLQDGLHVIDAELIYVPVLEPGTLALFAFGLIGFRFANRRQLRTVERA